jgi:hypothetical protein
MNRILFFGISLLSVLLTVKVNAQLLLPIRNLQADSYLNTSWDAPRKTILTQDFEGVTFPPSGWQERTNHAVGWYMSEGGSSTYFIIPEHTQYALVNDDAGGTGIDGCCEYLITPALDLSVCDGFKLTFDSYFNGNNGQKATVEMSTDNGLTWSLVEEMIHYPTWNQVEIDLSQWSGSGGLSSVLFAFHADDQGNQASGWAVDNVVIQSDSLGVTGYTLFLNQNQIAVITETEYFISPDLVTYGQNYSFCVRANYPAGFADTCIQFTSFYLPPPANLTAASSDTGVWFTWQTPLSVSEIISYNIYSNGALIANVPVAITSWFSELEFGEVCIEATAVHDITNLGFPGILAESIKETACGFVDTGFDLPFGENWTSGTLTLNKWTAGSNWSVTGQVGNEAPSVKYEGGKSPGGYSSALTSWHFNSMGFADCPMGYGSGLRYNVKLSDISFSGTEELIVELLAGNHVYELKRYKNEGSFDWLQEDFDITLKILDNDFQVRFRTEGVNPSDINAWYIDNIELYNYISDNWGAMLSVSAQRQGIPENDIRVSWSPVTAGLTVLNYILDDGSVEFWHGTESSQYWQGNEFPVSDAGVLQKASVFLDLFGTSSECVIDIFDGNRNLVGSSEPFIPLKNAFTDVSLPNIPFSGTFYAMFRTVTTGQFMDIALDATGPFTNSGLSWIYDGVTWCKMVDCEAVGGVFMIRISALVGDTVPGPDNPCDILGYNIYRKEYSSFPAGPNQQGSGEYSWIGSVPFGTNEFVDRDISNIDNNCFEYRLTLQYLEGEGSESGSAWSCIYVDQKELQKNEVNMYPNPANEFLIIEINTAVELITVYNLTGTKVAQYYVPDQSEIHLNVSNFAPGIYSLRFNTTKGESFSRKFVKL